MGIRIDYIPMSHSHEHSPIQVSARVRTALTVAVVPFVVATLTGLVLLWPSDAKVLTQAELPTDLIDGEVTGITPIECRGGGSGEVGCQSIDVRLDEGAQKGRSVSIELVDDASSPRLEIGDDIVVAYAPDAVEELKYYFADFQRKPPLMVLGVLFALFVVLLGRWRGVAALAGFAISLSILIWFVLPAILQGTSPLLVSITGASAVMLVALYLAHGVNVRTTTALLGTFASLTLTGGLAYLFVELARLSGFSSEEAFFLRASAEQVNLQGLVLGGIIIGSLGVLDDVTITQASAVWELHIANPAYGFKQIYRSALRIGRDHIASTVNTLVLAYAGAALPLLVLFSLAESRIGDVLNGEIVAEEIVRTLVGSIGLVAAVPITTALAAFVVVRRELPEDDPGSDEPGDFWHER